MTDKRETVSLEEQLRQDRRLAAAHRRRKRLRWSIPLSVLGLLLLVGLAVMIKNVRKPRQKKQADAPADAEVTISFVGDIALDQEMMDCFRTDAGYNFKPCFYRVTAILRASDLAVGNLEGNVSADAEGDYVYPPALLDALYEAGFDLLQTANSWSIQNGISGLTRTKQAIQDACMEPVGTFATREEFEESGGVVIREVNGIRFAFVAFTKGMNNLRLPDEADYCVNLLYKDYDSTYKTVADTDIVALLNRAKAQNPDVIIALVHWGSEYTVDVAESQRQIADLMFRNGVTVIVGSHSHYVGPMEFSDGRLIAYDLGDFVSASDTPSGRSGVILNVRFVKHGSRVTLESAEYIPTYSAKPDESLETERCEVLVSLQAVTLYRQAYYDRVSDPMYDLLVDSVRRIEEQTGAPELERKSY